MTISDNLNFLTVNGQDYSLYAVNDLFHDKSNVINVQDYGVLGNGVVDDTDNILNALSDLGVKSNTIIFPKGTYIVRGVDNNGIIIKKSNVTLIFEQGAELKLIDSPTVNQGSVLQIADYNDLTIRGTITNVKIFGLKINGNKNNQKNGSNSTDGVNSGLGIEDATNVFVKDFEIFDCDGYGVGNIGSNLPNRGRVHFENGLIYNNHYDGVDFKAGIHGFTMRDVYSFGNGYGGNIVGRDGMGFDLRGTDGLIDNCVAGRTLAGVVAPNASGNFRIRENSGRFVSIQNSHSYNAPYGTYGFNLIGTNTGQYVLTNCTSFQDDSGFRLRQGYYKMFGCQAQFSAQYGFYIQEDADGVNVITTTTSAISTTKQTLVVPVIAGTNLSSGMFVRITDGTNYVEGNILSLVKNNVTIKITSNFGGTTVNAGANIVQKNYGAMIMVGCSSTYAGTDGLIINSTPFPIFIDKSEFSNNGRYGIKIDTNNFTIKDSRIKNNAKGLYFINVSNNRIIVENNEITDDQTDKTQSYAIEWAGTNTNCKGFVEKNYLLGNVTGTTLGTIPTNVIYQNNF